MTSFLQTIVIILLAYYGLKIIFKFSKPYLIKYIAKKANERFGQAFGSDPFNNSSIKKPWVKSRRLKLRESCQKSNS